MSEPRNGPLHSAALYNPHLHEKTELVDLFVARRSLLELLVMDLRATLGDSTPQHHLIIGQRGMGKTMLLRRLGFAIEGDSELAAGFLPLTFPEEQYNVARLSDFWLNCIDALSDWLERFGRSQEAARLDEQASEIRTADEERRSNAALAVLTSAAESLQRRLVLLVDNIDLIFSRVDKQEWALREALSGSPAFILVGASSEPVATSYDYGRAFYDFFRIHDLEGLDLDETRALIIHHAEHWKLPDVKRLALDDPARIRVLHTLTGGNPRTIVLLFNVLALGIEGDVRTDLERLLDQCTPLYKARFEALAPQAQQVVHALAVNWDPTSAGELAGIMTMDVNAVSSQLTRLVKQGIVEKVQYEPETKIGFQIAERFFNIWYLMRASRRVRRRLLWLVEFLKTYYSQGQLRSQALAHFGARAGMDPLRYAEGSFALAGAIDDRDWRRALEDSGTDALQADEALRPQLGELVDLRRSDPRVRNWVKLKGRLERARPAVLAARPDVAGWQADVFWNRFSASLLMPLWAKVDIAEEIAAQSVSKLAELWLVLESEPEVLEGRYDCPPALASLVQAVSVGIMFDAFDLEGAARAEKVLGTSGLRALAAANRASFAGDGDLPLEDPAFEALGEVVFTGNSPYPPLVWLRLTCRRGLLPEIGKIIEFARGNDKLVENAGLILELYRMYYLAEKLYSGFLEINQYSSRIWFRLGCFLSTRLDRIVEAESALRKSLRLDPENGSAWKSFHDVLLKLGRLQEAEAAAKKVVELRPPTAVSWVAPTDRLASSPWSGWYWRWPPAEAARTPEAEWAYADEVAREIPPEEGGHDGFRANVLAHRGDWPSAFEHAKKFLSSMPDYPVAWTMSFFSKAVQDGRAREALQVLVESGAAERWRPLREALEAAARGKESYLRRVAPEVRQPAKEILAQLLAKQPASENPPAAQWVAEPRAAFQRLRAGRGAPSKVRRPSRPK
jgi:tetratricopeptide (TPR) repeat protein